jgi:hypothetical protein
MKQLAGACDNAKDMTILWAILLIAVSFICLLTVLLTLPGTWLMLAATALVAWLRWDQGMISPWTLAVLLVLAIAGELLEMVASSAGAMRAGASRWGSLGALVGGIVGAVAGTFLIPVPLFGSLIGACAGAAGGAVLLELSRGRPADQSARAGVGAGLGRLAAVAIKFGIGLVMWVIIAVAALVP